MKKLLVLFVGFIILTIAPLAAMAQEAPAEAPKEPPKNSGYQGGFFTQNDDGSFKLTLKGQTRLKYYYQKMSTGPESKMSFQMRAASLSFGSVIAKKGSFGFDLLHSTSNITTPVVNSNGVPVSVANMTFATINVINLTAGWEVVPEFAITAGMVGLPLDMPTGRLLTEPPITATQQDGQTAITPLRDSFGAPDGVGISLSGAIGKFNYTANLINGNEDNYAVNPNKRYDLGANLTFDALDPAGTSPSDVDYSTTPKLTFNAGGMYQCKRTDGNTSAIINYQLTGSLGARFKWKGLGLTTQTYYRNTRFATIGTAVWARPRLTDFGYYVDLGYFVVPKKFELAAQAAQIFRQGPDNDSWSMGGGLNYYIFKENFKLQLAYTLNVDFDDVSGTESKKTHNVNLQLIAKF